ncbi:nitroreductase [Chloroherpeton thalassium ATCC 35110]|uniref:Nitroreductase n=1 Tax=Chloroherpeton thalassium (strain ATCC 35110 / GB-78) TaxID=517418 RepID=B3QSF3_CHLT3|nr:nitroreductase family protein [Chloroherpeton thalassium]ACF12544.1 nitroreductase [Chloroherpeton thalassium ATCC 35110]
MIKDLILKNRSYRRFLQDEKISTGTLKELIELARLSPSAANLQPLKYILSNDEQKIQRIFTTLRWAGYLKEWPGPKEGERPSAYIIMLGDRRISENIYCDEGIAAQSILLGATEKGLGGCVIASVQRDALQDALGIPGDFQIFLVLALGVPKETVVLEDLKEDVKYWRSEDGVHHVPKRSLDDIILNI